MVSMGIWVSELHCRIVADFGIDADVGHNKVRLLT